MTDTVITSSDACALHMDHADIRREVSESASLARQAIHQQAADIRHDIATSACNTNDLVKSAGWQVSDRVGTEADRIVSQDTAYFISNQDKAFSQAQAVSALRAVQDSSFQRVQADIQLSGERAAAASALAAEKIATASALASAKLSSEIAAEGNKTREYLSTLKMTDLNRELQERQNELVECRARSCDWERNFNNSQFAQLTSQVNNLLSQVQETRQGIVNFGSMAGQSGQQTSTSNNVR